MSDLPDSLRADILDDVDDLVDDLGVSVQIKRGGVVLGTVTAYISSDADGVGSNSIGADNPGYKRSHKERKMLAMIPAASATGTHGSSTIVDGKLVELLEGDYILGVPNRELGLAGDGTSTVRVDGKPWRPTGGAHYTAEVSL